MSLSLVRCCLMSTDTVPTIRDWAMCHRFWKVNLYVDLRSRNARKVSVKRTLFQWDLFEETSKHVHISINLNTFFFFLFSIFFKAANRQVIHEQARIWMKSESLSGSCLWSLLQNVSCRPVDWRQLGKSKLAQTFEILPAGTKQSEGRHTVDHLAKRDTQKAENTLSHSTANPRTWRSWKNLWETGLSAYRLFRTPWYHLELNWTELAESSGSGEKNDFLFFFLTT